MCNIKCIIHFLLSHSFSLLLLLPYLYSLVSGHISKMKPILNIVLLGKKGAGKSAAGNTILGPETFVSKKSPKLVTRDVVVKSKTLNDLQVNVYDTPGFCDAELSEGEFDQMINEKILQKCESDLCVFLLVIKPDSFAEEDLEKTVEKFEKLLGKSRLDKTWILFTNGDELQEENMTIEAFLEGSEPFKELVAKYDERYHVFNNKKQCTNQVCMLISKFAPSSLGLNVVEIGIFLSAGLTDVMGVFFSNLTSERERETERVDRERERWYRADIHINRYCAMDIALILTNCRNREEDSSPGQ